MTPKQEFIKELLDKSKKIRKEFFIPKEVELKISELEKFDISSAIELSNTDFNALKKQHYFNFEKTSEMEYKTKLISFSTEKDFIKFYPSFLEEYYKNTDL